MTNAELERTTIFHLALQIDLYIETTTPHQHVYHKCHRVTGVKIKEGDQDLSCSFEWAVNNLLLIDTGVCTAWICLDEVPNDASQWVLITELELEQIFHQALYQQMEKHTAERGA